MRHCVFCLAGVGYLARGVGLNLGSRVGLRIRVGVTGAEVGVGVGGIDVGVTGTGVDVGGTGVDVGGTGVGVSVGGIGVGVGGMGVGVGAGTWTILSGLPLMSVCDSVTLAAGLS